MRARRSNVRYRLPQKNINKVSPWRHKINLYRCGTVHSRHHWLSVAMPERLVLSEAAPHSLRIQEPFLSSGSEQTHGSAIQSSAGRMLAMPFCRPLQSGFSSRHFRVSHSFHLDFLSASVFSPPALCRFGAGCSPLGLLLLGDFPYCPTRFISYDLFCGEICFAF